jgi:hypothetical protein
MDWLGTLVLQSVEAASIAARPLNGRVMVPLTCGKLQAWRGVAAMLLACAACVAAAEQGSSRAPQDLIVSSALERIAAPTEDAAASVAVASDTVASHSDELIVSVRFTNTSAHVVDSIRITSAVPADLRYRANSASAPGGDALFSVDGGRSFGRADELTTASADGEVRAADPAEYTHVRWVLRAPLDAGATGIARFRAVPR